jgi:hypothetical protein
MIHQESPPAPEILPAASARLGFDFFGVRGSIELERRGRRLRALVRVGRLSSEWWIAEADGSALAEVVAGLTRPRRGSAGAGEENHLG